MNHGMAVLSRYTMVNVVSIINKYKCGYSTADLADGLNQMLSNPAWVEGMGIRGRAAVEDVYNAETLIKPLFSELNRHG